MRFDSYHPTINFIFFFAVISGAIVFNQPIFLLISFVCPFVYSIILNGKKALLFNLALLVLAAGYTVFYASVNHFGITQIATTATGNRVTLESVVYGGVLSMQIASVIMWFSCVHSTITGDKVVYLFGRLSPRLSLYVSMILRAVPRIKEYAKKIHVAQQGIGRGINQGSFFKRIVNMFRLASIVLTWAIDNSAQASRSMRSRGYLLRGRTAFSIYRFDNRDRFLVIVLFVCITVISCGWLLDQTTALYNPEIVFNAVTPLSCIFFAAYFILSCIPTFIFFTKIPQN